MKRLFNLSILLASIFLCTVGFNAQTITATISGTVTDANGAIVPGAMVTITSIETGLTKSSTATDEGRYVVTFLQPGTYNIKVEKQGFAENSIKNIKLEVAQTATLDITLQVTGGVVNVEVDSDSTPLLQSETSNLETTIESKLVEELPTADRNIFNFVNLVPGTIDAGTAAGNPGGAVGSAGNRNFFDSNFSVSGGRASSNDILLDGVTNTIGDFGGVAISPPQDSIREFKTISGVAPAEYGRTAGGIVTISTKAGGNQFRGALYEYFQDRELNANGFIRNRNPATAQRTNINRNQFGGAISGPIYLPRFGEGTPYLYNGKNRSFFFFNYEARREDNPFPTFTLMTVPTAAQRTGNLSDLLGGNRTDVLFGANNPGGAAGTPVRFGQIFNPYGPLVNYISVNPTTGAQTNITGRPIIPNNDLSTLPVCTSAIRTAACLDPVALAVLRYIPLPNSAGSTLPNTPGVINNFAVNATNKFTRDIFAGRIDQKISDKQNFFGRFSHEKRRDAQPNYFGSEASNARTIRDTFTNFTFNHVYSFAPTVINNFRYGYTRVRANQVPNGQGFDGAALGLPSYLTQGAANLQFPDFTIGGGADGLTVPGQLNSSSIGGAGNNQPRDVHTIANGVTIVRSNHTFKMGGEYRLYRFYPFQYFTPQGSFTFDRIWTRGPVGGTSYAVANTAGSALGSFLLGLPASGNREAVTPLSIFKKYGAGYFQDDWKIRSNLTLNLGVRWEIETGTGEANNLVTNFDFNAPSPLQGIARAATDPFVLALNPNVNSLKGLLAYPEGGQTEPNKKQFSPRIGFAYSINNKTTLRGGFGLFYLPLSLEGTSAQGTNFTTGLIQSTQTAQTTTTTVNLQNPFPNGIPAVSGNSLGALTQLGGAITAVSPKRPTTYNQQWNLVLQRQLAKNLVLDVAYVGSRGVRLPVQTVNLNQLSTQVLSYARDNFATPGGCGTTAAPLTACTSAAQFLSFQVANPFQGLIPAVSTLNGATVARAQLLRRFPQYQTVTDFRPLIGESKYHALQINLQKRFSDGLSGTFSYVWSKLMDTSGVGNGAAFLDPTAIQDIDNYRRGEYSLSTLDVPHRVVGSFSYELPFGKNKPFGKNLGSVANALLGGFQLSGTATWQKGTPILIVANGITELTAALTGSQNAVRRPNRVGPNTFNMDTFRANARAGLPVIDITAFSSPNSFTLGNASRTHNDVRRDSFKNFDLSLIKNFSWSENRQKLQLRAEALNVLNLVVFGTPGNNINSANFGIVTTQGNRPRIMQLVARYTF